MDFGSTMTWMWELIDWYFVTSKLSFECFGYTFLETPFFGFTFLDTF